MQHLSTCNKMQDWSEAEQAAADTPEKFRDEGYHEAVDEMGDKKNTCTCGVEQAIERLSDTEEVMMGFYEYIDRGGKLRKGKKIYTSGSRNYEVGKYHGEGTIKKIWHGDPEDAPPMEERKDVPCHFMIDNSDEVTPIFRSGIRPDAYSVMVKVTTLLHNT